MTVLFAEILVRCSVSLRHHLAAGLDERREHTILQSILYYI